MREILFKGKRCNNGEWIEGGIIPLDIDSGYVFIAEPFLSASTLPVHEIVKNHMHLIIPETMGQYTGLVDSTKWEELTKEEQLDWLKNHSADEWKGKKIFEGDIIKHCCYNFDWLDEDDKKISIGTIKYENGCFILDDIYTSDGYNELSCVYDEISLYGKYDPGAIFKVIGNIHDNPELLN